MKVLNELSPDICACAGTSMIKSKYNATANDFILVIIKPREEPFVG